MIDSFKNIIKFDIGVFFSYENGFVKNMSGLFIDQTASFNAIRVVRKFDLDQVVNAIFDSILSFVIQFFYEFSQHASVFSLIVFLEPILQVLMIF